MFNGLDRRILDGDEGRHQDACKGRCYEDDLAVVLVGEVAVRSETDKEAEDWATEVIVVGSGSTRGTYRTHLYIPVLRIEIPVDDQNSESDLLLNHWLFAANSPVWTPQYCIGPLALEPRLIYAKQLIYHTRACGIPARLHLFKILQSTFGFRGYHSIVKRAAQNNFRRKGGHSISPTLQRKSNYMLSRMTDIRQSPAPGPRGTDLHIQTSEFGLNRWRSHGQMTSSISIWFRAHERPQAENGIRAPMDSRIDKTDSTKLNRGNDVSARLGPA
ncbi:hypothetical protein B0H11DRAFT_1905494 [Mycena galericulata]|nr:hypothetical protein B0H11DRAFT_1905494 [Mycena galericulata]